MNYLLIENSRYLSYLSEEYISHDVLTFCKKHKEPVDVAAKNGDFNMVKYLIEHGYDCTKYAAYWAANGGYLNIVKYLMENGKLYDESTIDWAIGGGHIDVIQYLIEECKIPCAYKLGKSIKFGRLDIVKYLFDRSDIFTIECAVEGSLTSSQMEIVRYLLEDATIVDPYTSTRIGLPAWIFKYRLPATKNAVMYAAEIGDLKLVEYLVGKGFTYHKYCIKHAERRGYDEIAQFLSDNL